MKQRTVKAISLTLVTSMLLLQFRGFAEEPIVQEVTSSQETEKSHEKGVITFLAVIGAIGTVFTAINGAVTFIKTIEGEIKPDTTKDKISQILEKFNNLSNQLKSINQKISAINNEFKVLYNKLDIQHNENVNQIIQVQFSGYIGTINACIRDLLSLVPAEEDLQTETQIKTLQTEATRIYGLIDKRDLGVVLSKMHTLMVGDGSSVKSGLGAYKKLLISKVKNNKITLDSACENLLYYFILRLYQQNLGLLVYKEYLFEHHRQNGTDGQAAFNKYYKDFMKDYIDVQCEKFLSCIDEMVLTQVNVNSIERTNNPFFSATTLNEIRSIYKKAKFALINVNPDKYKAGLHVTVIGEPLTVDSSFKLQFSQPADLASTSISQTLNSYNITPYCQWKDSSTFITSDTINISHVQVDLNAGDSYSYQFKNSNVTIVDYNNSTPTQAGTVRWHGLDMTDHGQTKQDGDIKFSEEIWTARNIKAIPQLSFVKYNEYARGTHPDWFQASGVYRDTRFPELLQANFRPKYFVSIFVPRSNIYYYYREYLPLSNHGDESSKIKISVQNHYNARKYSHIVKLLFGCELSPNVIRDGDMNSSAFQREPGISSYPNTFIMPIAKNSTGKLWRNCRFFVERVCGIPHGFGEVDMTFKNLTINPVSDPEKCSIYLKKSVTVSARSEGNIDSELVFFKFDNTAKRRDRVKQYVLDNESSIDSNWELVDTGHFSNQFGEQLLFYNPETNSYKIGYYTFDDENLTVNLSFTDLDFLKMEDGYSLLGFGDFNGDGIDDMLIKEESSGNLYVYFVYENCQEGYALLLEYDEENPQNYIGSGDFNGDGTDDLLTYDSVNGVYMGHLVENGVITESEAICDKLDGDWVLFDSADCDGDAKDDLILLEESTQTPYFILLDGLTIKHAGFPHLRGKPNKRQYQLTDAGDFNNDGKLDLLWSKSKKSADGGTVLYINYLDGLNKVKGKKFRSRNFKSKDLIYDDWTPVHFTD